jgi:transposase
VPVPSKLRPSETELRRLYEGEGLTAQAIADRCQVEKISVLRWLKAAGVERRASGRGLANRGVVEPTADELRAMVHDQHLSYREIADRYGVDFTAVPYWLKKHQIERPSVWGTRRRGIEIQMPSEADLRRRREAGESIRSIAADVGVADATIAARCREYGIAIDASGWREAERFTCDDGHPARSSYEHRVDNWLTEHGLAHEIEPRYPFDRRYRADFLVGDAYVEVWGVTHNPAYQRRKAWKIAQCREHGLRLVQINHWQFAKGRKWWRPLLPLLQDPAGRVS